MVRNAISRKEKASCDYDEMQKGKKGRFMKDAA